MKKVFGAGHCFNNEALVASHSCTGVAILSNAGIEMYRAFGTLSKAWSTYNGLKPVVIICFEPMALMYRAYGTLSFFRHHTTGLK